MLTLEHKGGTKGTNKLGRYKGIKRTHTETLYDWY